MVAARLQYHDAGPAAPVTTVQLVDIDSLIEGQNVDDDYRPLRLFGEDISLIPECRSCAIAQSAAGGGTRSEDSYVAVDIDPVVREQLIYVDQRRTRLTLRHHLGTTGMMGLNDIFRFASLFLEGIDFLE